MIISYILHSHVIIYEWEKDTQRATAAAATAAAAAVEGELRWARWASLTPDYHDDADDDQRLLGEGEQQSPVQLISLLFQFQPPIPALLFQLPVFIPVLAAWLQCFPTPPVSCSTLIRSLICPTLVSNLLSPPLVSLCRQCCFKQTLCSPMITIFQLYPNS